MCESLGRVPVYAQPPHSIAPVCESLGTVPVYAPPPHSIAPVCESLGRTRVQGSGRTRVRLS